MNAARQPMVSARAPAISAENATPTLPEDSVHSEDPAYVLPICDEHRDADRVVDRGEHADERETQGDVHRSGGEAREMLAVPMPKKNTTIMLAGSSGREPPCRIEKRQRR